MENIKRVRAGNVAAYEDLVLKYEKKIYSAVMAMIKHEQDSLDITQNVFIKAYLHIGNFNEEAEYYTYLFKIALNECKDYWKKNSKKQVVSIYNSEGASLEVEAKKELPENNAEYNELQMAVNEEINNLPPEQKETVLLRGIYGLTYEEIAKYTGLDLGTVKSRLYRGRKKVLEALKNRNLL